MNNLKAWIIRSCCRWCMYYTKKMIPYRQAVFLKAVDEGKPNTYCIRMAKKWYRATWIAINLSDCIRKLSQ